MQNICHFQEYRQSEAEITWAAMKNEVEMRMKSMKKDKKQGTLIPLLKVKVVDVSSKKTGQILIWSPNEDLVQGIKEKSVMKINNLFVKTVKEDDVIFKTTKGTRFQRINPPKGFEVSDFERKLSSIEDILEPTFSPLFKEVDTLGVVINIESEVKRGYQAIQICDGLMNFVSIQFYGGLKKYAIDSIVEEGKVLIFSNLQWRNSSSRGSFFQTESSKNMPIIPCLYADEFTVISVDTKEAERSKIVKEFSDDLTKTPLFIQNAKDQFGQLTQKKPKILVSQKTHFMHFCMPLYNFLFYLPDPNCDDTFNTFHSVKS